MYCRTSVYLLPVLMSDKETITGTADRMTGCDFPTASFGAGWQQEKIGIWVIWGDLCLVELRAGKVWESFALKPTGSQCKPASIIFQT